MQSINLYFSEEDMKKVVPIWENRNGTWGIIGVKVHFDADRIIITGITYRNKPLRGGLVLPATFVLELADLIARVREEEAK